MAECPNNTILSRRAALSGVSAITIASIAAAPAAALAAAPEAEFARLFQEWKALYEHAMRMFDEQEPRLDALGPKPEFPETLREPLPGKELQHEDAWPLDTLREYARGETMLTGEAWRDGSWHYVRTGRVPVPPELQRRAAELLPVRLAYDAAWKEYHEKSREIEAVAGDAMSDADAAGLEALQVPVYCLADIVRKLEIADAVDLFDFPRENGEDARDVLFEDIRRLAAPEAQA